MFGLTLMHLIEILSEILLVSQRGPKSRSLFPQTLLVVGEWAAIGQPPLCIILCDHFEEQTPTPGFFCPAPHTYACG
jgi:hypothetical protein